MMKSPPNGRKLAARERTDTSLRDERVKVDKAGSDGASLAMDEEMTGIRGEADAARTVRRETHDAARDGGEADSLLASERQMADESLIVERDEVDRARARASVLRLALERSRLYSAERMATDKDLASERTKLDREIRQSTWLLIEERAAHDDTRLALTTRDEYMAIVSHDLRSPLSAVLCGAELLAKDPALADPGGSARRLVEGIRRNTVGMVRLINDLLDVERLSAGKLELSLRTVDLRTLVQQTVDGLGVLAVEKRLTLSLELPPTALPVSCDGARIAQVLGNLLGNAIKFTPAGGAIVVSASAEAGWTRVSVGDTGPGIPDAERSRIFERFSRLPSKDRTGLGLGLFIAKSIVDAHEGQLWVASAHGEGSVFSFALPSPD